jgi:hypothetical protein
MDYSKDWSVQFDPAYGGPVKPILFPQLKSWTVMSDTAIRYYSGKAVYAKTIELDLSAAYIHAWLLIEGLHDIASVKINGRDCGTIWTAPHQLEIGKALKPGTNTIEITVSNTWHNRLILDAQLPPEKRVTYTTAPFRLKDKPLLPAGITGSIKIIVQ